MKIFYLAFVLGVIGISPMANACDYPGYARKPAGMTVEAYAEISNKTLSKATEQVLAALGSSSAAESNAALTVEARLDITRSIVGGYAAAAFQEVGDNYFCRLTEKYKSYPDKMAALKSAKDQYRDVLDTLFTPALYVATPEMYRLKREEIRRLDSAARALPIKFKQTDVSAAISEFEYREKIAGQLAFKAGNGVASGGGCLGSSLQSLVVVDTRVLNQLNVLRGAFGTLLTGNGTILNSSLAGLAASLYGPEAAAQNLSPSDALCVRSVAKEVRAAALKTKQDRVDDKENKAAPSTELTPTAPDAKKE